MNKGIIAAIAAVVVLVMGVMFSYNGMKEADLRVAAAYGQVENQMQRRADLIPNLVETVKGYTKYEQQTIKELAQARAALAGAQTPEAKDAANTQLSGALSRLLAVAESNPELKANQQYLELMRELSGSENRIAVARRDYNAAILVYNTKTQTFPGAMLAGMFGFQPKAQFAADPAAKETPKVKF